jgi:hypothetical protein
VDSTGPDTGIDSGVSVSEDNGSSISVIPTSGRKKRVHFRNETEDEDAVESTAKDQAESTTGTMLPGGNNLPALSSGKSWLAPVVAAEMEDQEEEDIGIEDDDEDVLADESEVNLTDEENPSTSRRRNSKNYQKKASQKSSNQHTKSSRRNGKAAVPVLPMSEESTKNETDSLLSTAKKLASSKHVKKRSRVDKIDLPAKATQKTAISAHAGSVQDTDNSSDIEIDIEN